MIDGEEQNVAGGGEVGGLDLQLALSRVGGHMELLKEVAVLFLEDYPRLLAVIDEAMEKRDAERVGYSAHNLKGSVCNFGAPGIVLQASQLERQVRAGDWPGAEALVPALSAGLEELRQQLEALQGLK